MHTTGFGGHEVNSGSHARCCRAVSATYLIGLPLCLHQFSLRGDSKQHLTSPPAKRLRLDGSSSNPESSVLRRIDVEREHTITWEAEGVTSYVRNRAVC